MENLIKILYGLDIKNINKIKQDYIVKCDEQEYLFCKVENEEEFMYILDKTQNIKYINKIVINKANRILTEFEKEKYVLIKKETVTKITPFIIKTDRVEENILTNWIKRVDILRTEIRKSENNNLQKKYIMNYILGMAESAISLYQKPTEFNEKTTNTLIHYSDCIKENYYNIAKMKIGNIGFEIKYLIKNKIIESKEIRTIIKEYNLSKGDLIKILAIFMYPEELMTISKNKEFEIRIERDIKKYNDGLEELYELINDIDQSIEIKWIKKELQK